MAITPDGKHAYVTDWVHGGTVWVIDTATRKASAPITVGGSAHGVAITPDGRYVYVARSDITANGTSPAGRCRSSTPPLARCPP